MTRFARAKGSKSSNEKKPEDATPWAELKASAIAEHESQSEHSDEDVPTQEEIQSVWAAITSEANFQCAEKNVIKNNIEEHKKANKKRKRDQSAIETDKQTVKKKVRNSDIDGTVAQSKKKKSKSTEGADNIVVKFKNEKKKLTEDSSKAHMAKEEVKQKKKKTKTKDCTTTEESASNVGPVLFVQPPKEKKRRKPELQPNVLMVNGEEVKVVPFDGFLVQEDDAIRLKELRRSMIHLPISERERAIKLERRRAEKSLARLKKRVCFHCRGSGHNLSECPQLANKQTSGSGICYKCGSTEHTHFQCKVTKGQQFRYAECFICKEQGHIAKQCPDNPRGLYPKGGACSTCGDVTHLKKDCPKFAAQKEQDTITLKTRSQRMPIEALDDEFDQSVKKRDKKINKHIKF